MTSLNNIDLKQLKTIIAFIFWGLYLSCSTATSHPTTENDLIEHDSIQLIDYNSESYTLKKIEYVGECVLSNHLSNDTLKIELLSRNLQFSPPPDWDFILKNDTLNIAFHYKYSQKDTLVYNKVDNRYDTLHLVHMAYNISGDELAPKGKIETFRFKGFRKCPTTIYLNGTYYKKCPTEDIESKTYNGNIINRINKNGFKEGVWLEFYETGELREKKYYENGRLLNGKTYDRNGKDLHYITESSGGITTLQTDSLFNK
jgi:antitoxin component YwqK of YwqJK toxin-antitoxin module